jgi:hypothetical protein
MKIYVAHPITGLSYEEISEYYTDVIEFLRFFDYEVMTPLCGKGYLRTEKTLKSTGLKQPLYTDHAIIERDRWMVTRSDVVYLNLMNAKTISIGCLMELAWAHDHGIHAVVAMEPDNIHRHAFVLEAADIILESHKQALDYLKVLKRGSLNEKL